MRMDSQDLSTISNPALKFSKSLHFGEKATSINLWNYWQSTDINVKSDTEICKALELFSKVNDKNTIHHLGLLKLVKALEKKNALSENNILLSGRWAGWPDKSFLPVIFFSIKSMERFIFSRSRSAKCGWLGGRICTILFWTILKWWFYIYSRLGKIFFFFFQFPLIAPAVNIWNNLKKSNMFC